MNREIPVVILAGGLGTRLREETEFRPKPMVPIGGKPILWHIMKHYSYYGFKKFIICLGYKGEVIKDYFLNYQLQSSDFSINTETGRIIEHQKKNENWDITLVDTGQDAQTGARIARIADYIDTETFMLTYGDGLSDINLNDLLNFHLIHKKNMTVSGVLMPLRFGHLALDGNKVIAFSEKKRISKEWINGGFFVCNKKVLAQCSTDSLCVFERDVVPVFSQTDQLMAYKHEGFWYCMDTLRDQELLAHLWETSAPWKVWESKENNSFFLSKKIKENEMG